MERQRRSLRLPSFDYSSPNAYFITICLFQRRRLFGFIQNGEMVLNALGRMVQEKWNQLLMRYPGIDIDEFIIMPDHVHGIIWITDYDRDQGLRRGESCIRPFHPQGDRKDRPHGALKLHPHGTQPGTLGRIIQGFKSISTVAYIRHQRAMYPNQVIPRLWQRNYHEHIIRSERGLRAIREYIRNNPAKWEVGERGRYPVVETGRFP